MGALAYASAIPAVVAWWFGVVIPGLNLIGPLAIWIARRDESRFARKHGGESVNLNLSAALLQIPLVLLTFSNMGRVVVWIAVLGWLGVTIWAALGAYAGRELQCPGAARFVR